MKVKDLIERLEDYHDNDVLFLLDGTEVYPRFIAEDDHKNATLIVQDFVKEEEDEWVI